MRVDPAFGFEKISLELSVPALPPSVKSAVFAEHVFDSRSGVSTDTVIVGCKGGIAVSYDLGEEWRYIAMPEIGATRLRNSFTLSSGRRLLQEAVSPDVTAGPGPQLFLTDVDGKVIHIARIGESHWHGPRSIDERHGTIMFAEYPNNAAKYKADFEQRRAELEPLCRHSRVFRSRDNGLSWQVVFSRSWKEIRHFHTLVSDPFDPGVWWLSSGDTPIECRIWCSRDDGDTWQEATDPSPQVDLHREARSYRMSVHRYTDIVILPDRMIWGTDDLLGPKKLLQQGAASSASRIGSRIVLSTKTIPLSVATHGYVGNQVRSIVDVGPVYMIITEAKPPAVFSKPQIVLMSKKDPGLLSRVIDVFDSDANTGFTYSMTSKAAKDGCFFSMRKSTDVFPGGPQLLKWSLNFD